jgi:hypothetical protein
MIGTGEYISRADAIEAMYKDAEAHPDHTFWTSQFEALMDIPAADVRPMVKAHWYWDKDGMDWGIGAWRCSACKAMSPMWWNCDRGSPMHKSGHNFCPNCGADMREES